MKNVIDVGSNSVTTAQLDGNKLYVHTKFYDDLALAKNRKIQNSGALDKAKLGLHDDEDIRLVVSCPSHEQWSLFKRKHPDVYALLTTRGGSVDADQSRMKGALQLSLLEPEWVIQTRL
jgi:hypothetical protein